MTSICLTGEAQICLQPCFRRFIFHFIFRKTWLTLCMRPDEIKYLPSPKDVLVKICCSPTRDFFFFFSKFDERKFSLSSRDMLLMLVFLLQNINQVTFTCSKLPIETLEKGMKCVKSLQ